MHNYKLKDKVYHDCDRAPFIVTGIREDEIEIEGDWSGGTHNVCQKSWVKFSEIEPYDEKKVVYFFNGEPFKRA